ncbi:uncharacterized protein LOC141607469 [Silene latifolia]|uniref:uncharacterized protein LOC141607469 n=1 Tax=Silene latifolia TaxID=37657 RepID=UPI003D770036
MKVAHLMKPDKTGWNEQLLDELFLPFEKDRIRNIRLRDSSPADDWCWDPSKDGEYSVKTAYHLLYGRGEQEKKLDFVCDKWLWNTIWRTPVLPRVKTFVWQLCHDALPTKHNIGRRLGSSDTECPFCSNTMETCLHTLRDCGWVYGIWEGVGIEEQVDIWVERVREWVEGVLRELGEEERMIFLLTCWAIWERRNNAIFKGGDRHCGLVVRRMQDLFWELKKVDETERGSGQGAWISWVLGEGIGEVEKEDAGVVAELGIGLGAVARSSEGKLEWVVVVHLAVVRDPTMVKAEVVLMGLKEAKRVGHARIIIESACLNFITELRERKTGRADIFRVYDDILSLCCSFVSVDFSYIRRESNSVAHNVAHSVPWVYGRRFWIEDVPRNIIDAISSDINDMI